MKPTAASRVAAVARALCSDTPDYGGHPCLPCQWGAGQLVKAFREDGEQGVSRAWSACMALRPASHLRPEPWRAGPDPDVLRALTQPGRYGD